MATQRPHDAFPVRVSGAPCEGCSVVGTRRIELTRPRSTIRKAFDLGLVCGDDVDSRAAFECSALAPAVRQAVTQGRSALVMAVGSEQSGKSAAVRADDGLAALVVREVFSALAEHGDQSATREAVSSEVGVSAVLCAITQADGETALTAKQPVRERVLDALGASSQPAAGLVVREHADGQPIPPVYLPCISPASPLHLPCRRAVLHGGAARPGLLARRAVHRAL